MMDIKSTFLAASAIALALPTVPALAQLEAASGEHEEAVAPPAVGQAPGTVPAASGGGPAAQGAGGAQTGEAPLEASAAGESDEEIVVTGRFAETGAKSAMKMDVPVLDTPFAVSSYSDDFIKSLETTNVTDLYNYMTGVKKAGNTAYDLTMRGFRTGGDDRNAIMVDGLPGLTTRFGSPSTIGLERIELVKGPMSVLYGAMQPGGFVNLITKKPEEQSSALFELRGSTYAGQGIDPFDRNGYNIAVDSTGPVTDDLFYRVVAEHGDRDLFRDFSGDRSLYALPSLRWDIGPDTSVTGQLEYRKLRQRFDTGLVAPDNDITRIAPFTTRYNEPENFRREEGLGASLYVSHSFGDWTWNTGLRNVDYDSQQQDYSPTNVVQKAGGRLVVLRRARELHTNRTYRYVDTNLTGKFSTGSIDHQLLIGFNAGKDIVQENRVKFFNSTNSNAMGVCPDAFCFDIDLYDPVYGLVPDIDSLPATNPSRANQAGLLTNRRFKTSNWAFYVSDLVTLTDWLKLSLSGRAFEEKQRIEELRIPGVPDQNKTTSKTLLPSFGVLVQPSDQVTFYGSYSESYVPADADAQDITGRNPFGPVSSDQIELGVKTQDLIQGVTATAAIFRINQRGILQSFDCPTGTTIDGVLVTAAGNCSEPVGAIRSEGLEAEANIALTSQWQLIAGYAYTDAKVRRDTNPNLVGVRLNGVPEHSANVWSRYDFENGFGLGLGVTYTGQREGKLVARGAPGRLNLPAYTVVDLGLYYTSDRFSANLKIGNLLDEEYLESSGGGSLGHFQIAPGAPRNITLSTRLTF